MKLKHAKYLLPLMLLAGSANAHAFVSKLTDAITAASNFVIIYLGAGLVMLVASLMTVAVTVVPILADVTLVVCAMLMPICLAFWPINKSWAMNAIGAALGAVLVKAVVGFFLEIILGSGGALAHAVNSTRQQMFTSWAAGREPEFTLILGSMLGIVVVMVIMLLVIMQLPGIVRGIFGGFSPSVDLGKPAAAAAKKVVPGK